MGISRPDRGRPRIGKGLPVIWHDERHAIFSCNECGTKRKFGHGQPVWNSALLRCAANCQGEKYQMVVRTILLPKSKIRTHFQEHNGTSRKYDCEEGIVEIVPCSPHVEDRLIHTQHTYEYMEG